MLTDRVRVGINGYGVIGKRVADAVTLQDDMELVGVADVGADYRIKVAVVILLGFIRTPIRSCRMGPSNSIYTSVQLQHSAADFWAIFRSSTCAVERRRAQFFAFLAEGKSEVELLALTHYSVSGARKVLDRSHTLGLGGLGDGRAHNQGAPSVLTAGEQQRLAAQLQADFGQGVVWSGKMVQDWIRDQFGKDVYLSRTYEFMRLAGFSPQRPRPRHVGGNTAAQDDFKSKS